MNKPKIALITNIPAPYREGAHSCLHEKLDDHYHVFYCGKTEHNRLWKIEIGNYHSTFLKEAKLQFKQRAIYYNSDIVTELNRYKPDVVITAGFSPTMLYAFLWCKFKRKRHVMFTDGTLKSEEHLTFFHRIIRRFVYHYTEAFIAVSHKTVDLYKSYKIDDKSIYLSPYCVDNELYRQHKETTKKYDLLFSGQFIDRKLPFFFIRVAELVNEHFPCKVALIGTGELKDKMLDQLNETKIEYDYLGFIQADELPRVYSSAKLLLFPTTFDAWGLVANEALAAGVPVITCENAGVSNELVINNDNGYVLPLVEKTWADHIVKLLSDDALYQSFSEKAVQSVQKLNFDISAEGILQAAQYALRQ